MPVENDLFGEPSYLNVSSGELSVEYELIYKKAVMIERSNWLLEYIDPVEGILLDMEEHIILTQATGCFISGMDAATIICSVAFIERLLTDAVEIRSDDLATKRGFGNVIAVAEKLNLLHPFYLSRLRHLNKVRVSFSHEKGPDFEYSLFRRKMNLVRENPDIQFPEEIILQRDAKEAISFCYLFAKNIKRNFPRLNLPGHPSIREDLQNVGIFQV